MKSSENGYGTVAKAIHWISALLILVLIGTGLRSGYSEDVAVKAAALRIHVPVATPVLVLTAGRLVWWWRFDRKPPSVGGVPAWQESAAAWTHRALYGLIFVLLASGIATSVLSGLPDALFGSAPFPDLESLAPRTGHGIAAVLILAAVGLHAGAALYHHVVLKDRTLARLLPGRGSR